jgi:SAM-dependent methyltransferase
MRSTAAPSCGRSAAARAATRSTGCSSRWSSTTATPARCAPTALHRGIADAISSCATAARSGATAPTPSDFADGDIARIKHDLGQIYLDASRKPAPDDFSRDLAQLSRSEMCDGCPEHERCTGMFEPTFEDAFSRDEARVHEILAALEGDVLDVGCGHAPYVDALAAAAASGRVRYVGCDPDESALAELRSRHPWARLHRTDATRAAELGAFDHALVLRSWNHWPDADAALAAVASALRPGGSLLVVDDVAFGLARTGGQSARARTGSARFEHHRNDDAHAAHRRIAAAGFELLERRDVGPRSSCAWLLRYRKPAGVTVP